MKSNKNFGLLCLGIIWAVSLFWFAISSQGCPRLARVKSAASVRDTENWYGVYLNSQKIGYSATISHLLPGGSRRITNRSLMRLSMMESPQEIASALDYELDRDYRLRRFDFKLGGAADIRVRGEVVGKRLKFTVLSSGSSQSQQLELSGPITLPDALEPMLAARRLKPGQSFVFTTFDPTSLSLQPTTITVMAAESLRLSDQSRPAFKLRLEFSGMTSIAWIDSSGNLLREEGPLGITLVAEERDRALRLPDAAPPLDILTALAVPASGPSLARPRDITCLRIRPGGIDPKLFDLNCCRQRFSGELLEIAVEEQPAGDSSSAPDSLDQWLQPTPLIQSQHPAIAALADSIVGQETDRWRKVSRLSAWVFSSLKKTMTATLPSALEVASSRRGDCNEHATLFCALARSQHIPCRLCLGVVYLDGFFYYHAWNQVWCGRWIEVDPTFGQCPADAARLRLVLGDLSSQSRLLPAMGQLQIEILEGR